MAEERIKIIVEPDVSGFERELEGDLKRIDVDFNVDVKADTDQLNTEMKAARAKQEADPIDVPVGVDTTKATAEMQRLTARISKPVMKVISANVAPALAQLSKFTATASRPILKTVTLITTGATKSLQGLSSVSQKSFAAIGRHAKSAAAVIGTAIIGAAVLGKDELIEAERANNQTAARLKSTGGIAGVTQKSIDRLSASVLKMSGIDDQATQAAQNMLLTFTKVRNEAGAGNNIFDQSTLAIADMATAMAGGAIPTLEQMQTTTIRMGKALNDPVKGVTALSKAGVQFTQQQKDQIKALTESGDLLGAQKIILKEVNTQFGGSAAATGKAEKGLARLREAAAGLGAGLLEKLLPVLLPLAEKLQEAFDSGVFEKYMKAFKPVVDGLKEIFDNILIGLGGTEGLNDQIKTGTELLAALGYGLKVLAPAIGVVVTAIVILTKAVIALFIGFGNLLGTIAFKAYEFWNALVAAFNGAKQAVMDFIDGAINTGKRIVLWFQMLPKRIGSFLVKLGATIFQQWMKIKLQTLVIWNAIVAYITAIPGRIYRTLAGLAQRLWQIAYTAFQRFRDAVVNRTQAMVAYVGTIKDKIISKLSGAGTWLYDTGERIINGLWNGMKAVWNNVADWLGGLKDKIVSLKGPPETDSNLLVDNGMRVMNGFWEGMKNRWQPISGWLGGVGGWLKELVSGKDANAEIAQVIAGNKQWGEVMNNIDPTGGLLTGVPGGAGGVIGPAKDKYDVYAQGQLLAKAFTLAISSWQRSIVGNTAAGGATNSQHITGFAVDFAGIWQNMDKLAKFARQLVGKAFTQVLWQIADHFDHVHIGWLHRRAGGRVQKGQPLIVGETGQEGFVPDSNGMILSNAKLQRLLSMGRRVDKIEGILSSGRAGAVAVGQSRPMIQQTNDITLVHPNNDPSSIMAALNARLDMFARTATAGLAP